MAKTSEVWQSLYQNKYNSTADMFLFKVGFNSLIKMLSWISNSKLHELLGRIEKSSGQTTVLQKSMWSCTTEVWELFLTHFPMSGETPICSEVCVP